MHCKAPNFGQLYFLQTFQSMLISSGKKMQLSGIIRHPLEIRRPYPIHVICTVYIHVHRFSTERYAVKIAIILIRTCTCSCIDKVTTTTVPYCSPNLKMYMYVYVIVVHTCTHAHTHTHTHPQSPSPRREALSRTPPTAATASDRERKRCCRGSRSSAVWPPAWRSSLARTPAGATTSSWRGCTSRPAPNPSPPALTPTVRAGVRHLPADA